jgi:hypothetical protein
MKSYQEIQDMLKYLDNQRCEFVNNKQINLALAVASQIELLK